MFTWVPGCAGRSWGQKGKGVRGRCSGVWVWKVVVSMKNSGGGGRNHSELPVRVGGRKLSSKCRQLF